MRELAELSGLHLNTVGRCERGRNISLANFEKLVAVLGYEIELMELTSKN